MKARRLRRIFIANRGEIAVRIIRACRSLDTECVVAVSEADKDSLAAQLADRAVCVGPAASAKSYLNANALITAALGTSCDAIHPGYGYLSERADFQRLCSESDIVFIGPSGNAIERMGDKIQAIELARSAGVPVVPGKNRIRNLEEMAQAAQEVGYPCLIKASAGGGGRGMRVVREASEMPAAFQNAQAEARAAFGDDTVYLEKYIERARHIEVQVLADHHGNVCHLFERDCSVQRRHQKLIEEAPSVSVPLEVRLQMRGAALALTKAAGYTNAGTVEFIYDAIEGRFYFLEMNTRVQVEHPVTEMITGVDIVAEQIRIASGLPLSFEPNSLKCDTHAIECRINAEDGDRSFRPSPGMIEEWSVPDIEGVRLDTHCYSGYAVPPFYDSLIAKVIAHGATREQAIERLERYLAKFKVVGITTTIPFHERVIKHPRFRANDVTTSWLESEFMSRSR